MPTADLVLALLGVGDILAIFIVTQLLAIKGEIGQLKADNSASKAFSEAKWAEVIERFSEVSRRLDRLERHSFPDHEV